MDGWEEDDDPLAEHLKHCPDCGWAIVASIEAGLVKEFSQEYPYSERMLEARKATFGDKWPHEAKEGWQCKIKNVSQSGYHISRALTCVQRWWMQDGSIHLALSMMIRQRAPIVNWLWMDGSRKTIQCEYSGSLFPM